MPLRRLLMLVALILPLASQAADVDALKQLVEDIPYPQVNLKARVSFSIREVALHHAGDPSALFESANARLAAAPEDASARLDLATALDALGLGGHEAEYARAATSFASALEADPGDLDAKLGIAQALWEGGNSDEALPIIDELADDHPELWWPPFARAQSAAKPLWDLVDLLGQMAAMEFETPEAFHDWFDSVKTPAVAGLESAIEEGRRDPEVIGNLIQQLAGNALMYVDDANEASGGQQLSPGMFGILVRVQASMAAAISGQDGAVVGLAGVADGLAELARQHPSDVRLQVFSRWASVERALTRAGGGDPMGAWPRMLVIDQRQLTRGELATAAMLKREGGQASDVYELMSVYAVLHGNLAGALSRLRASTEVDPTSAERWEAYLGTLTRTGDLDAIGAAAAESLMYADSGTLRCTAAKVHQKQGDLDAAATELNAAIALDDERLPLARLMLGTIMLKQGDAEGAIEPLRA
ncbi:MAG TPA: tetratricopeptide repeat protein, partial [Armatimonadota bacterium]|nr:tetratricopeptide repeat protein [Armatimonadota bacterium]